MVTVAKIQAIHKASKRNATKFEFDTEQEDIDYKNSHWTNKVIEESASGKWILVYPIPAQIEVTTPNYGESRNSV